MVVKSAERTLRVLEFFAQVQRPASVSEIESALELPQSSTSVLLHSLVTLGYLERLPLQRQFRPTLRVTALGAWLNHGLSANPLIERLEGLRGRTNETVIVGHRVGTAVQYIYVLPSQQTLQVYMSVGSERPLSLSASGRALLSAMTDTMARKIIRRNNADAKGVSKRVNEDALVVHLGKIRQIGVSETESNFGGNVDHHAIAMLVPRKKGSERITLGVAGPKARMLKNRREMIDALREWTSQPAS